MSASASGGDRRVLRDRKRISYAEPEDFDEEEVTYVPVHSRMTSPESVKDDSPEKASPEPEGAANPPAQRLAVETSTRSPTQHLAAEVAANPQAHRLAVETSARSPVQRFAAEVAANPPTQRLAVEASASSLAVGASPHSPAQHLAAEAAAGAVPTALGDAARHGPSNGAGSHVAHRVPGAAAITAPAPAARHEGSNGAGSHDVAHRIPGAAAITALAPAAMTLAPAINSDPVLPSSRARLITGRKRTDNSRPASLEPPEKKQKLSIEPPEKKQSMQDLRERARERAANMQDLGLELADGNGPNEMVVDNPVQLPHGQPEQNNDGDIPTQEHDDDIQVQQRNIADENGQGRMQAPGARAWALARTLSGRTGQVVRDTVSVLNETTLIANDAHNAIGDMVVFGVTGAAISMFWAFFPHAK
ncbi:hypothetical protein P171DRAFT_477996 [Karstenula rhodostoma CBS 690.94]|uniref:Uncharacterized protein n=1 Tax=Karstenula rhodostoma CBS 690.94 TaxID=1392251 RepID=A0A9P4P3L4_9PLEO|nr:hypothetical protein P171DRAFT_477996 [Karstenula rhodostoma CBS 690.94]